MSRYNKVFIIIYGIEIIKIFREDYLKFWIGAIYIIQLSE